MSQLHAIALIINEESSEIERFRARHRLLTRGWQQDTTPAAQMEDLDVHEGRRRKVSAKWRQQQNDDSHWAQADEMHNAFNFSASPEDFGHVASPISDKPLPCNGKFLQNWPSVENAVTSMGFNVLEWVPHLHQPSTLGPYVPLQPGQCQ